MLSLSKHETTVDFWVYILRCSDGSYYTGHTDNLEKRVGEHQAGEIVGYTSIRRPLTLVFAERFESREDAISRERQVKGWGRQKKEALIRGDWQEISRLASKQRATHDD